MPWIENVAASDIPIGFHHDAGPNSMLISIVDPAGWRPEAKHQFKERHNFEFLDIEKNDFALDEAMRCSEEQAAELVRLLQHALDNRMNVVVHCMAGICRSGAVCEVGVMMGFNDTERFRSPNLLVKHRMMKALGWTYSEQKVSERISNGLLKANIKRTEAQKENLRKPKEKVTCPHCGKVGGGGSMIQWHFNNCKDRNNSV